MTKREMAELIADASYPDNGKWEKRKVQDVKRLVRKSKVELEDLVYLAKKCLNQRVSKKEVQEDSMDVDQGSGLADPCVDLFVRSVSRNCGISLGWSCAEKVYFLARKDTSEVKMFSRDELLAYLLGMFESRIEQLEGDQ